jgi:pilus assembly protein Flp/PilA
LPEREVITAVLTTFTALASSIVRRDDEDGQGLAEYALILALIAIVAIVALVYLGSQVSSKLSVVGTAL